MKLGELVKLLSGLDPEMEVLIQVAGDEDFQIEDGDVLAITDRRNVIQYDQNTVHIIGDLLEP
jgi:hypothetical protein